MKLILATIAAFAVATAAATAQLKSADDIVKDIQVEGRVSFAQNSLPFKLDSTELATAEAKQQVKEIAKALTGKDLQASRVKLTGFTCDLGSDAHNLDLSKRRAAAIKKLLVQEGVDEKRLDTDGKGEAEPAQPNTNEQNRQANRRVVITPVK